MTIIVPNTGSTFSAAGSVLNAANHWAWLGFVTAPAVSGCVMWYRDSASTSGSEILPIVIASSNGQPVMFGPYNSPNGLYAGGISGGCAIAWLKVAS